MWVATVAAPELIAIPLARAKMSATPTTSLSACRLNILSFSLFLLCCSTSSLKLLILPITSLARPVQHVKALGEWPRGAEQ
jgi:hypothetical protein